MVSGHHNVSNGVQIDSDVILTIANGSGALKYRDLCPFWDQLLVCYKASEHKALAVGKSWFDCNITVKYATIFNRSILPIVIFDMLFQVHRMSSRPALRCFNALSSTKKSFFSALGGPLMTLKDGPKFLGPEGPQIWSAFFWRDGVPTPF